MTVAIIIPTFAKYDNFNPDRTKNIERARTECLTSLLETTPKNVELVLASNGADMPPITTKEYSRIKRVHVFEQGQCKAVNAAVATTNTDYIMVTNDDMIYPPGWFEELFKKEFMCWSPKLVEPIDGAPTFIKYPCGGAGGDFDKQKFLDFAKNYDPVLQYQFGFNLPFVMPRDLWNRVEGYDIAFDPWSSNSDSDLEYKLKLAGVQPLQLQKPVVYHFSQTSGTFHPSNREHWEHNYHYFADKWGFERVGSPEIWTATFTIDYDKLKYRPKWADLPDTSRGKHVEWPKIGSLKGGGYEA